MGKLDWNQKRATHQLKFNVCHAPAVHLLKIRVVNVECFAGNSTIITKILQSDKKSKKKLMRTQIDLKTLPMLK